MPSASSATSRARSPSATLCATPRQNATARPCVSGRMKLTDAPPSTQSHSTAASWSICDSSSACTRRTDQVDVFILRCHGPLLFHRVQANHVALGVGHQGDEAVLAYRKFFLENLAALR